MNKRVVTLEINQEKNQPDKRCLTKRLDMIEAKCVRLNYQFYAVPSSSNHYVSAIMHIGSELGNIILAYQSSSNVSVISTIRARNRVTAGRSLRRTNSSSPFTILILKKLTISTSIYLIIQAFPNVKIVLDLYMEYHRDTIIYFI